MNECMGANKSVLLRPIFSHWSLICLCHISNKNRQFRVDNKPLNANYHLREITEWVLEWILVPAVQQGSTLRRARMPWHLDLFPGHINFCGYMREWESDFSVWACTVLVFPAVYISFTGLWHILAEHVIIFAGHVNFQNHVPDGHINQMLNVKPPGVTERSMA